MGMLAATMEDARAAAGFDPIAWAATECVLWAGMSSLLLLARASGAAASGVDMRCACVAKAALGEGGKGMTIRALLLAETLSLLVSPAFLACKDPAAWGLI